jgi:peptidylprolyl isomerase
MKPNQTGLVSRGIFWVCLTVWAVWVGVPVQSWAQRPAARGMAYQLTVQMDDGRFVVHLFPDAAPRTVARVVELVQQQFYDGLTFHRLMPGIMVQGGDPRKDGTGGSGLKLKAEFNTKRHVVGTLSMARAEDPDSADSQFFICLKPQPMWDGKYTVIGQVVAGMEVVRKIKPGDVMRKVTVR